MLMFGLLLPGDSLLILALCPVLFFSLLFLFSHGHCESWKYTESLRLQSLSSHSLFLLRSPCGWTECLSEAKRSRVWDCKTHTWGSTSHQEPLSSSSLLSLSIVEKVPQMCHQWNFCAYWQQAWVILSPWRFSECLSVSGEDEWF